MAITSISVDCATSRVSIIGTSLSVTPEYSVTLDGMPVSYTLISATAVLSVLEIIPFVDGTYCLAPIDTTLATSTPADIQGSDSVILYTNVTSGFFCADFICSIQVTDSIPSQWRLHRFDLKIRAEDSA